ncbi:MAG: beta-lactamase family protein [Chlamydiae bacterium]|nr:beta-lactamase family protein [Chlamydiota bacterium]
MASIHFKIEAKQFDLQETDVWSPNEIFIDGTRYQLLGEPEQLGYLREKIPEFSSHKNISFKDLQAQLIKIAAHDIVAEKAHAVGISTLLPQYQRLEETTNKRLALQKQFEEATKTHPEDVERLQTEVLEAKKNEMKAYLRYMEVKEHFRGSVLVTHNGERLICEGYGPADEKGHQNTENTRSFISSMGKMLTASAIMLLEQEKKISLDDKINDRLPAAFRHPLWEGITIRHLLTHTSGISSYGAMPKDEMRRKPFTPEDLYKITLLLLFIDKKGLSETDEINSNLPEKFRHDNWKGISVKDLLIHDPKNPAMEGDARYQNIENLYNFMTANVKEIGGDLLFNPGEMFSYSNSGYVLLGQIIKNISKEGSYEAYMKKMFERIGMPHTDFSTDSSYDETLNARGFWKVEDKLALVEHMQIHASKSNAAGGIIVSNLEDMEKFDAALYDDAFLHPDRRDKMFTADPKIFFNPKRFTYDFDDKKRALPKAGIIYSKSSYGFGFIVEKDKEIVGHDGSNIGFNSFFIRDRKKHDLFVILGNIDPNIVSAGEITNHLEDILYS